MFPELHCFPKSPWNYSKKNIFQYFYYCLQFNSKEGKVDIHVVQIFCCCRFDGRRAAEQHWSAAKPAGFGSRARLVTDRDPAELEISPVRLEDAGLYRCRVDFKANQTQNQFVALTVIGE